MKSALISSIINKGLNLSIFFGKLSFFVTQKTVIAGIMLVLALILLVFLIKKDIKNIQIKDTKKSRN